MSTTQEQSTSTDDIPEQIRGGYGSREVALAYNRIVHSPELQSMSPLCRGIVSEMHAVLDLNEFEDEENYDPALVKDIIIQRFKMYQSMLNDLDPNTDEHAEATGALRWLQTEMKRL